MAINSNKNADQCRNKFKYLKSKYVKKNDNMSEKASGQSFLNFEFFEELDEIFNKDPNIVPVALASSSTYKSDLTKQRNETLDQSDDNLNISTEADTDKTQKNLLNPRQKKRHSNRKKKLLIS